jgi:hypothetical protein
MYPDDKIITSVADCLNAFKISGVNGLFGDNCSSFHKEKRSKRKDRYAQSVG